MGATSCDAIVIGGGPNGLAAAARLGQAGRKVVVLERRATLGGLSGAIEFHPGYRVPGVLHDEGLLSPKVATRLGLEAHGLAFAEPPAVYLAETGGRGVLLSRDPARNAGELSEPDAAAYAAYRAFMSRLAPLVERLMTSPPPPLSPDRLADYWEIVQQGLGVWKLGRAETLELLRVAPMCVADFLQERFAAPLDVEALAQPAVLGTWAGPWSAGTNTNLILAEAAPGRPVAGGPAALVAALEAGDARPHVREDHVRVRYLTPPRESLPLSDEPQPVRWIVFPRYTEGGRTELRPLSRPATLRRLLDESYIALDRLNRDKVASLVQWMRTVECFELSLSSLDEAVPLLCELMQRPTGSAPILETL